MVSRPRDDVARARKPVVTELLLFLLFGGAAAAVNLLVGWQLYGRGHFHALPYWGATAIAAASGLLVNFALNYAFNFGIRHRSMAQQFSTFCLVSLGGILLTSGLSQILLLLLRGLGGPVLHLAGLNVRADLAAHVAAVGLTVLYSFPAHKIFSFHPGTGRPVQAPFGQLSRQS